MKVTLYTHKKYYQAGMTLIELMITVAIISILAAIAFNQFAGQQDKGLRGEGVSAIMQAVQAFEACGRDNGGIYTTCVIPAAFVNSASNKFVVSVSSKTATTYMLSFTKVINPDKQCTTMSINHLGQKFFTSADGTGSVVRCWSGT